ncbi:V-type ATP synthase subunit F [candidate division WOR-3 bacterium]|nr:V-type ATP synthase subunit F [candidate division WOR-3 bacterium]
MSTKIAAIGERDVILPFKAIGADIFPVSSPEEAHSVLGKLLKEGIGIVLVPDDLIPGIKDFLAQTTGTSLPCILPIPGSKGSSGHGTKRLRELIKKAVGVDLMKNT